MKDPLLLAPAALHILLALAPDDLHGYAIMQEISRQSEGKFKIGPGTMYDNLQRLIGRRLIQELGARPDDDDPRRRYYRLTPAGREVLSAEIARLERLIRAGKMHLAAKPGRA